MKRGRRQVRWAKQRVVWHGRSLRRDQPRTLATGMPAWVCSTGAPLWQEDRPAQASVTVADVMSTPASKSMQNAPTIVWPRVAAGRGMKAFCDVIASIEFVAIAASG